MDAFVESLFAPEMRSSLFPSASSPSSLPSCGRVKALLAERTSNTVLTPPGSANGNVPPPPNSLLGGGIAFSQYQAPFQPPTAEDAPLFVRLHEDDMFSQMLNDQDFPDFKKETSSSSSLLLEPLDLPRSTGGLKDTFYNMENDSFHQFRAPSSSSSSSSGRSNVTTSNGYTLDGNMMPVFPLGAAHTTQYFSAPYPSNGWVHEASSQPPDVSTPGGNNFQRVHTMKHMMAMASMGVASSSMLQHPSPGSVDMFNPAATNLHQHQFPAGLWVSMARSNAPESPLPEDSNTMKQSVERPPFSLTISPPASLTNKAIKELIVSADFGITPPPSMTRTKRPRSNNDLNAQPKRKAAKTSSMNQENNSARANGKVTKGKKCIENGCTRRAQSNSRCKAHGGGARCQYKGPGGCTRSSQGGGFCRAHGGGKRCEFPGCTRGQQRKGRCYVHGGIRKCQFGSCEKKDRGNGFCISHGGGKRCEHPGCSRAVRRGLLCQVHEAQNGVEKEQGEGETVAL